MNLQGGSSYNLQGGSMPYNPSAFQLQPAAGVPQTNMSSPAPTPTLGVTTSVDPAAPAGPTPEQIKAAEDARRAAVLRGEVTNLVNTIKDIFNSRYGQVDASAGEQSGKLNERFANESSDVAEQVTGENNKLGAIYAGRGAFDSSYRGNAVDTVTKAGSNQIRDLGTELQENITKIAAWVTQQKAGFDANKQGMDVVLSRLAESTDPAELTQLRNTLDSRITELRAGAADNNTSAQNAAALASIAPSSARTVQLKTTLSQILAGNADPSQKAAIGQRLISSAGLSPEEAQRLQIAFQSDLASTQEEQPTA